jgi:hypothetical protein
MGSSTVLLVKILIEILVGIELDPRYLNYLLGKEQNGLG